VHEALGEVPGAREVLARFGIDTCCGGELPLAVAAEHHGVDLDRLLDALARADGSG
jgi:iron-sulfur cluster repair protein YtfE (RIC family)